MTMREKQILARAIGIQKEAPSLNMYQSESYYPQDLTLVSNQST